MQNNENYSGFDLTMYNLFTLLREMYYTRGETETNFLQKSGGTVAGSLTIQGNLVVNGQSYTIDTENLKVGDYTITLAKDNEQTLTSMVGMVVPKYDGTNYGFFGWDADGYAYVGDLTNYDGTSAITLANNSSLQKISTIDTTNTVVASNGVIYVYDATSHCFKKPTNDNKYYVIRNGAFVETELFTEQKSKNIDNALYNLGAYDTYSVSNGVVSVVRGGSRAKIRDFTWEKISNNRFATTLPSAMPNGDTSIPDLVFSKTFIADTPNHVYSNVAENIATINIGKDFIVYVSATYYANHTAEQFIADYGDIEIQYKLSSTYTDTYIENTPNIALDQNGANWLQNEWKKGLNLFDEVVKLGTLSAYGDADESSATRLMTSNYLKVEPNTIYSFNNQYIARINFYNSTKSFISTMIYSNQSITTPSNCYYLRFDLSRDYGTTYNHNIMLNIGTHPYPYQPYNGEIVHKKDIEPVLLWENSSPDSAFAGQTISNVKDMSNFKYIVFEYKQATSSTIVFTSKIRFISYSSQTAGALCFNAYYNGTMYSSSRLIQITNGTTVVFDDAYSNTTQSNSDNIPIAIYGTNVL